MKGKISISLKTAYMSYITTHKKGIRLVLAESHINWNISTISLLPKNSQTTAHARLLYAWNLHGMHPKLSSVSPQTKDVNVGIMLKQTNIILKYLRKNKRYRDVQPEKKIYQRVINCKEREGGCFQLTLFFHLIAASEKPGVTTTALKAIYIWTKTPQKHLVQHKL